MHTHTSAPASTVSSAKFEEADTNMPIGKNYATLPGRLGNRDIWVVRFGHTRTYMYMNKEKSEETKKLVDAVNSKAIKLVADVYENPRTTEFSAIASVSPEPGIIDADCQTIEHDPYGQNPLNHYGARITAIAESALNIGPLFGISREINLIVSHDAHTFHKDAFPRQFQYLKEHPELPKCSLIHDLTLVDWDMAKGAVSGTIFHDPVAHDRFLLALLPSDSFGTFSIEPIDYPEDRSSPQDPGARLLPFHAVLSPEDLEGSWTAGSSKGQRISSVIRGLVKDEDAKNVDALAKELHVNRPTITECGDKIYDNGIILKRISLAKLANEEIEAIQERDNVQVVTYRPKAQNDIHLQFALDERYVFDKHVRFSKKDGGFNMLSSLHEVDEDSIVMIVNNSIVSEGYKHYSLSEDQSDLGKPWIQMYQFESQMVMQLTKKLYDRLSLTPVLELLYRDEVSDCGKERTPCTKLATHLDLYIFTSKK